MPGESPAQMQWDICAAIGDGGQCYGILQRIGFTKATLKEEIYWIPSKEPAHAAG